MVVTVVAALAIAWVVQAYLVKPYRIPSGSMENTLRCRDRVLVNRLGYHFRDPHRLDVVVFTPPRLENRTGKTGVPKQDAAFIKRIIGLPGDSVEVRANRAWVNGKALDEPYLHPLPEGGGINATVNWGPRTVPKGAYLMMGDHRDDSVDGRVFGYIPREDIIGRAFIVYWPWERIGRLPSSDPGGPDTDPNCEENQFQSPMLRQ